MILSCPQCQSNNRMPNVPTAKIRCGKCHRVFTPIDLAKGRPEPEPVFELPIEDDTITCDNCDKPGPVNEDGVCAKCAAEDDDEGDTE